MTSDYIVDVIYLCIKGDSSYTLYRNDVLLVTKLNIESIAEALTWDIIPKSSSKNMADEICEDIMKKLLTLSDKAWVMTHYYIKKYVLRNTSYNYNYIS